MAEWKKYWDFSEELSDVSIKNMLKYSNENVTEYTNVLDITLYRARKSPDKLVLSVHFSDFASIVVYQTTPLNDKFHSSLEEHVPVLHIDIDDSVTHEEFASLFDWLNTIESIDKDIEEEFVATVTRRLDVIHEDIISIYMGSNNNDTNNNNDAKGNVPTGDFQKALAKAKYEVTRGHQHAIFVLAEHCRSVSDFQNAFTAYSEITDKADIHFKHAQFELGTLIYVGNVEAQFSSRFEKDLYVQTCFLNADDHPCAQTLRDRLLSELSGFPFGAEPRIQNVKLDPETLLATADVMRSQNEKISVLEKQIAAQASEIMELKQRISKQENSSLINTPQRFISHENQNNNNNNNNSSVADFKNSG